MSFSVAPQTIVMERILRRLSVQVEPARFYETTMVVELDEDKLIAALGSIMNRYVKDYNEYTLQSASPPKIEKILLRIGEYEVEAEESFTTETYVKSLGYKKKEK